MSEVGRRKFIRRQGGVAVVTALLLTTLAITIVASLFWQQQVQVRSIENQRYQLQKKWVLRGALDWAGLILREDKHTSNVDHLGEPWAVNLGDTRLDQYVENGKTDVEDSEATLSGQISDAQAKFNLTNLSNNGAVDLVELAAFAKLLTNLRIDSGLARQVASQVAMTQDKVISTKGQDGGKDPGAKADGGAAPIGGKDAGRDGANTTETGGDLSLGLPINPKSEVQFLKFSQIDDLLSVPGFNADMVARLRNFVTVLPVRTKINVNTTSAEVLSARIDKLSMTDAALMIASRDRAYFLEFGKFKLNFPDKINDSASDFLDFQSNYFVINGRVKLNRSLLEVNALIEREGPRTKVLWIKEN